MCGTNISCKQNLVKVYDSWRTGDVTTDVKEAIANLLHSSYQGIYLRFPEVQRQKDSSSCGVYGLVYAHILAEGNDPSGFDFPDEAVLRGHLFQCIMSEQMSPFYTGQAKYTPGKAMKSIFVHVVYQIQGMKWSDVVIVRNGSYHFACVSVSPGTS